MSGRTSMRPGSCHQGPVLGRLAGLRGARNAAGYARATRAGSLRRAFSSVPAAIRRGTCDGGTLVHAAQPSAHRRQRGTRRWPGSRASMVSTRPARTGRHCHPSESTRRGYLCQTCLFTDATRGLRRTRRSARMGVSRSSALPGHHRAIGAPVGPEWSPRPPAVTTSSSTTRSRVRPAPAPAGDGRSRSPRCGGDLAGRRGSRSSNSCRGTAP